MQWAKGEEVRLEHANILHQAVALEGHGDNVAPALLGDLVCGTNHQQVVHSKIAPTRVTVCVPDFYFLTSQARSVLPGAFHGRMQSPTLGEQHWLSALRIGSYTFRAGDERHAARTIASRLSQAIGAQSSSAG